MNIRLLLLPICSIVSLGAAAQPCTDQVTASHTPATACANRNVQLNATALAGATYDWVGPGSFTSNQQNPTIPSITFLQTGDYIVTATVGSCVYKDTIYVDVVATPLTPSVSHNGPVCEGDTLSAVAAIPPTIPMFFYWYGPNNFSAITTVGQYLNRLYADSSVMSGIYKVISKSPINGCESDTVYHNIVVNTNVVPSVFITAPQTSAGPMTAITFTATASDGGANPTYQWQKNGIDIGGATNSTYTGITGIDFNDNDTVWVLVTADPAYACPQTTASNYMRVRVNLGVDDMNNTNAFTLFPNPGNGRFTVQHALKGNDADIEILNATGQVVYRQKAHIANTKEIVINSNLPQGLYLLQIKTEATTSSRRFAISN